MTFGVRASGRMSSRAECGPSAGGLLCLLVGPGHEASAVICPHVGVVTLIHVDVYPSGPWCGFPRHAVPQTDRAL